MRNPKNKSYYVSIALISLCAIGIAGSFISGLNYEMNSIVHARISFYALPAALSWIYHGAQFDHSAFVDLADIFFKAHPNISDETITIAVTKTEINRDNFLLFPADDKGSYLLAVLSIALFGPNLSSLYLGAYLVLIVSVICYLIQFRNSSGALALLGLYALALWACIPAFAITKELYSITNPRVFGVVAVVPFLHIALTFSRPPSWVSGVLIAVQTLILIFCFLVRSTEVWPFLSLLIISAVILVFRGFNNLLLPCSILIFGFLVFLPIYQQLAYHPDYFEKNTRGRLFWHNVGIGLALSPKLAQKYNLTLSDNFWHQVHRKASLEGADKVERVFGERKQPEWTGIADDVSEYERLARSVVVEIAKENPAEMIKIFFIYKPVLFLRTIIWWAGAHEYNYERLYIADQIGSLAKSSDRVEKGIFWRPFFLQAVLGLVLIIFLLRDKEMYFFTLILAAALLGSLLAPSLTYPAVHTLAVPLLLLTLLLYVGVISCADIVRDHLLKMKNKFT